MNAIAITLVVPFLILGVCFLPWLARDIQRYSQQFKFAGTIALLAFVVFDLLPGAADRGGQNGLLMVGAVWLGVSLFIFFREKLTKKSFREREPILILVGALALHMFASGIFLITSQHHIALAWGDLGGLIIHKMLEGTAFSYLLIACVSDRARLFRFVMSYALMFPAGVLFAKLIPFVPLATTDSAQVLAGSLTSVSLGILLVGLIQGFLFPLVALLRSVSRRNLIGVAESKSPIDH